MKVNVLGCGPAGLLAAHAAAQAGHEPVIHSIKEPSIIKGAQFIHTAIPGVTADDPDCLVEFEKWGTQEGYAQKVYGVGHAPTSWDAFPEGEVPAWSMIDTYQRLWDMYDECVIDTEVRAPYIMDLILSGDPLFSSITPLGYCMEPDEHIFDWQDVWITDSPAMSFAERNVIVYNGNLDFDWYRSSQILGHGSTEYGGRRAHVRVSKKPLATTCTCFTEQENFHRVGRFGEFKKALLVHDAYLKALEVLDAL